jgi:lipoyl(octanoyl) transferase
VTRGYLGSVTSSTLTVLRPGLVDYRAAWAEQRRLHDAVVAGDQPDTILLLEHPSVFTAGKRTEPADRPVDGTPVVDVDRGGKMTWHGPGQLVGYPIFKLREHERDLHLYMRRIEETIIVALSRLGLTGGRRAGWTGVWTVPEPQRKLASIGVAVKKWVTLHGFALNVSTDLARFAAINPCGLDATVMTSVSASLGRAVSVDEVKPLVADAVAAVFDRQTLCQYLR